VRKPHIFGIARRRSSTIVAIWHDACTKGRQVNEPERTEHAGVRDNFEKNHSYSQEECCMTRKIAGTCLAAVLGFALSAAAQQTPTTPQTPPTTTPQTAPTSPYPSSQSADQSSKSDKAGKSTTLTGCVQSGTTAGTYELTNIKGKGSMASSESSSSSASSSKTVKLVAAAGVDLSQHVGHQVEVKGSMGMGSASASASAPPSAASPSASASASSDSKEFNVTDVKMVSATCSAGTN
jgi:hypothetical protein